jgi:CRISPR-associated protein Csd1
MMLQALIAYAERENLADPDFETVGVRWLIALDRNGQLSGDPIALAANPDEKKPKPKRLLRPKSDPDFVSHGRSYFLCDNLERATVFVEDEAKREKRRVNQAYFAGLIEEAARDCQVESEALKALADFLRDEGRLSHLHSRLTALKAKTSENATFAVDGRILLESPELKAWWRTKNQRQRDDQEKTESVCLATGVFGPVCRTAGFIKLLGEDTKLISFNKECPAFESFGLSQAANAPVSTDAEEKFRSGLNALITQGLVFNNTVHLHWTREPIQEDPFDLLASADEKAVEALLKSVQQGQPPVAFDANAYYAMSLSGNGARIVVRDWLESTVPEVQRHVAEWFQDLAIVQPDGQATKRDFKFGALLYGMVRADLEDLSPALPTQLLHGALRGRAVPLPQAALAAALRRQRIESQGEDAKRNAVILARLALIKACLLRSPNSPNNNAQTKDTTMTECLNPESRDPAYLCGRLFAVFDRLQYLALGGVNAGVVERYYASASTTPALVMGRLFRNAQFHLAKTEGGVATNVGKDFEAITCALGDHFPASLDLESQGRFALGYYHQKADYRRLTAKRKEAEAKADAASETDPK